MDYWLTNNWDGFADYWGFGKIGLKVAPLCEIVFDKGFLGKSIDFRMFFNEGAVN